MIKWLSIFLHSLASLTRTRRDLAYENLLLRQQLAVLKEKGVRPQLSATDRSFWVLVYRVWPRWRDALHIVKPETVVRWHREGFRRHWARKCRKKGRFTVPTATFRVLFVLVVLSHNRSEILHTNVTEFATAEWTVRQILEAVGLEDAPKYLIRD